MILLIRRGWNGKFNERDQHCILTIPLSRRASSDVLTWVYSKDCLYSIKTAYMLGKGGNLENHHVAWLEIWNMEVSPKAKHFLWQLCSNTLPTRALLRRWHMLDDAKCPWCEAMEETSTHILVECSRVGEIWEDRGYSALLNIVSTSWVDILMSWKQEDCKLIQRAAILLWCLWMERNDKVFNGNITPTVVLLARVHRLVLEHNRYTQ